MFYGYRVSVVQDEKILDICFTTQHCQSTHSKMVTMVNFMLCVFYYTHTKFLRMHSGNQGLLRTPPPPLVLLSKRDKSNR